jgi:ATP-dependent exoDNAse (exonuclease V) alpha subunit
LKLLEKLKDLLENRNVLLTGGGGVGKSYLTSQLIVQLRREGKQVVVLGSTGVSAVNVHGQTIHSFFAFGISNNLEEMKKNDKYTKARVKELNKILYNADLLIIDEISMVSTDLMDMIHYRLKSGSFSGSLLFVGDFFQLPPIKSRNTNNSLFGGAQYAFESSSWEYFDPYYVELTKTKRTEDENFFYILSRIRKGELDNEVLKYVNSLRSNLHVKENNPTILFGRNKEAENMNIQRLEMLKSEPIVLKAKEKIHFPSLHVKRIESWKNALPVPANLTLKLEASVLFCTNKWGVYYNGQRGIIKAIDEEYVDVAKLNGDIVRVKRHEYTLSENMSLNGQIEEKPLVSIEQFPLKLAYAITIHKSQGMSIDSLVCNIDNIFEKSQFYVAVSRAKNPNQLLIDYSYDRFEEHLNRCVQVSQKVAEFYENSDIFKIEEEKKTTLF